MSSALKLGKYPGDDAPAWQLNEYALAARTIAEELLEEDDTLTARILGVGVEELAGGVASTAVAETPHSVLPTFSPVNCLAAILAAQQNALRDAAVDGLPAAEAQQMVVEAVSATEKDYDRHEVAANLAAITFQAAELHSAAA